MARGITLRVVATLAILADPRVAHAIAGELEPGRVHVALFFFEGASAGEMRDVRRHVRSRLYRELPTTITIEL